ncbi:hypothetical protein FE156_19210 [Streptomyces albidoflavus]|nr:hypothetical protein FE156_19210 [Streptomyces albidoflavus]
MPWPGWRTTSEAGQPQPGKPQPGQPQPGKPQPGQPQPGQPRPGQPQPGRRLRPMSRGAASLPPGRSGWPQAPAGLGFVRTRLTVPVRVASSAGRLGGGGRGFGRTCQPAGASVGWPQAPAGLRLVSRDQAVGPSPGWPTGAGSARPSRGPARPGEQGRRPCKAGRESSARRAHWHSA